MAEAASEPPILLIEDEPALVESIQFSLESEGLKVIVAVDGQEGLDRFRSERPSLVLLDLMLPRVPGLDVCRTIRSESTVPIMIVTAKDSEADKIIGLEIGADDYITKPFSMRELVSRVRSQLRRSGMSLEPPRPDIFQRGPVVMDIGRHEVAVRGQAVDLPPKEFKLLETLLHARGRLRTRTSLIDDVWGPQYFGDTKTLDVHVKRLRQKIERDPHNPELLVTVRGIGYRLVDDPASGEQY